MEHNNSMASDMGILMDLLGDDEPMVDSEQPPEYYIAKAEQIYGELNPEQYFIYLKTLMNHYNELNSKQKEEIINKMNIPEKVVVKTVIKECKKKEKKPKLRMVDDY